MKNILLRTGRRIFTEQELKYAYHRLYGSGAPAPSPMYAVCALALKVASKFFNINGLVKDYMTPQATVDTKSNVFTYTKHHLDCMLNRVYDLPEVVINPARRQTVNVLVPAFDFGSLSAGFFGVFKVAQFIKSCGHHVRLVMFDNFWYDEARFKKLFLQYPGMENLLDELEIEYIGERKRPLQVSPKDNCVATVWYSAWFARKINALTGQQPFLYLIQDYEAQFYPGNSSQALADQSYAWDYAALFSNPMLERHFVEQDIGGFATRKLRHRHFNNACAASLPPLADFKARHAAPNRKYKLAYYSRPNVNRNMFELGALTLIRAAERNVINPEQWEIYGMGIGDVAIELGEDFKLQQLPRMTLKEYIEVVNDFDLCLTLMASPHPSLIPFDLAGSGALVVTNSFRNKDSAYFAPISGNILCAEPDVEKLVDAMELAMQRLGDLDRRHADATAMNYPRSWEETWQDEHRQLIQDVFGEGQAAFENEAGQSGDVTNGTTNGTADLYQSRRAAS